MFKYTKSLISVMGFCLKKRKRGQITLFIILGILVVAGIVIYFLVSGISKTGISKNLKPGYD